MYVTGAEEKIHVGRMYQTYFAAVKGVSAELLLLLPVGLWAFINMIY